MRWAVAASGGFILAGRNAAADGEIVWSWRRDPGVKLLVSARQRRGQERPLPGESTYKPTNHCAGKAGMPRLYLSNPCAFFTTVAHGAAGAASARLSLRPLFGEGAKKMQNPGENESREYFRLFEN